MNWQIFSIAWLSLLVVLQCIGVIFGKDIAHRVGSIIGIIGNSLVLNYIIGFL